MNYEKLAALLSDSPAVKLLRAKNAPLILSFLYQEFKEKQRLTISNDELVSRLCDYLEALDYTDADHPYPDALERARKYIDDWCDESSRYLKKFPDESGTSVHELTADTEKAIQWMESLEKKEFIGTESRFLDIVEKLRELVENTSEDPRKRIALLERKKQEIEARIRETEISGNPDTFSDTQIKERFYEINKLGRNLISDFKEVEQNFRDITRRIYEKQTRKDATKGKILSYALDAADELKESDQGKSFYAFWHFLMAEYKQEELDVLIADVFRLLEKRNLRTPDPFIQKIKVYLHDAGRKVIDSNRRMISKLSRILGEKSLRERRKTVELITDIKHLAMERIENPPEQFPFIEIEGGCDIAMIMDRPLGTVSRTTAFLQQPAEVGTSEMADRDMKKLFNPFEIDREILEQNIAECLKQQDQITLDEIIRRFPLKKGLAEIVAYLSIASASRYHIIRDDICSEIQWHDRDLCKKISMPQVVFCNTERV
jgi:hypothetical protein